MPVIAIVAAIAASTAAGVRAEQRYGGRAAAGARRALTFVLYALLPPVTFFNLARTSVNADIGIGVLLAYVAVICAALAAWQIGSRALQVPRPATGAMICCTLVANTGYLGYPLVLALLGSRGLGEAVVYDVLVSGPSLLIGAFAVGAGFGARAGEDARQRLGAFFTRNPALYAAAAALVAPDSLAPDLLVDASRVLVIAILPVGFFAVGAALAEEAEERKLPLALPFTRSVATAVVLRMVLVPGLLFLLALPLIDLPGPYLLLAAMPCGLNCLVVAHAYGLDLRIASQAIAWSTAIAVVGAGIGALAF
jgi:predicted permease